MQIPFSKPPALTKGVQYVLEALNSGKICGDHKFSLLCHDWLEKTTKTNKAFLTTSGTHALELAAILLDLKENDAVIMPSFTFSSTANAFLLRGCKIKFVDIEPETMNINPDLIEMAITEKTKAIIPVHYAGVACNMGKILGIANKYSLSIIEDAAQAILSCFEDKPLGSIGDFGCISFHETKNITCGEGGALLINNQKYAERAEIVREKGTNRAMFFRGEVDKYTWRDIGSSYLPSDLNAALLFSQFEIAEEITQNRVHIWEKYHEALKPLEENGFFEIQKIPSYAKKMNGHIFFFKVKNLEERTKLLQFLKSKEIWATFHYIPLHSSEIGKKFGSFVGVDEYTTTLSERLVRLPIYHSMSIEKEVQYVIDSIYEFYNYPLAA